MMIKRDNYLIMKGLIREREREREERDQKQRGRRGEGKEREREGRRFLGSNPFFSHADGTKLFIFIFFPHFIPFSFLFSLLI